MPYGTMKKVGSVKKSTSGKGYVKMKPSMSKDKKKIIPGVPTPKKKMGPSMSSGKPKVIPGVPSPRSKKKPVAGMGLKRNVSRRRTQPMASNLGMKKQRW